MKDTRLAIGSLLGVLVLGACSNGAATKPARAPEPSAEEKPSVGQVKGNTRVRFEARVESVRMMSEYAGVAKPVHADPRFALVLQVANVSPVGMGIASNSREAFLIHSVAKLFRGGGIEDSVGGVFEFSVQRTQTPGGARWSDLRVEPPPP